MSYWVGVAIFIFAVLLIFFAVWFLVAMTKDFDDEDHIDAAYDRMLARRVRAAEAMKGVSPLRPKKTHALLSAGGNVTEFKPRSDEK